ncbi:hypothetical protein LXA43DRAFT_1033035 [Ganoderma leucocontextum]|nr:hypothetical protein LXA43DRAFT_1033035 [Ganoderma leucocontextum]
MARIPGDIWPGQCVRREQHGRVTYECRRYRGTSPSIPHPSSPSPLNNFYLTPRPLVQAESVTYHLPVPVLCHSSDGSSRRTRALRASACTSGPSRSDEELVVVGDLLLTDVVMENRMAPRKWSEDKASKDESALWSWRAWGFSARTE